jgi:hypothetical protein
MHADALRCLRGPRAQDEDNRALCSRGRPAGGFHPRGVARGGSVPPQGRLQGLLQSAGKRHARADRQMVHARAAVRQSGRARRRAPPWCYTPEFAGPRVASRGPCEKEAGLEPITERCARRALASGAGSGTQQVWGRVRRDGGGAASVSGVCAHAVSAVQAPHSFRTPIAGRCCCTLCCTSGHPSNSS